MHLTEFEVLKEIRQVLFSVDAKDKDRERLLKELWVQYSLAECGGTKGPDEDGWWRAKQAATFVAIAIEESDPKFWNGLGTKVQATLRRLSEERTRSKVP